MYFKQWLALFALFSLSTAWYLNLRTHAPVIPEEGIGRTPSSTSLVASASTSSETSKPIVSPHVALKKQDSKPAPSKAESKTNSSPLQLVSNPTSTPASTTQQTEPPQTVDSSTQQVPHTDTISDIELAIHTRVNIERSSHGLHTLSYDNTLATIARGHSLDMLANDYFDHADQNGCSFSCRIKTSDYSYWAIAENIYKMMGYSLSVDKTAEFIVNGWMNSPGHRANILNDSYTTEGIGVALAGTTILATENLAKPR